MQRVTFDLDCLRSFATGIELGSFSKAAERLGRSTSAVSAQLKKLEDQADAELFRKSGRGLALTEAGEILLGYARRLIEINDEAASAMRGAELAGWVRLGLQEDFGETLLTEVLGRFARTHPKVRIEARVARNFELVERVTTGKLDLALAWDDGAQLPHSEKIAELPLRWIGSARHPIEAGAEPLPLVTLEAPCLLRSLATAALDRAGRPWRLAFSSPSLAGLWAATGAGLGLTIRTDLGLSSAVRALESGEANLPPLPKLGLSLHRAEMQLEAPAAHLGEIMMRAVRQAIARLPTLKTAA